MKKNTIEISMNGKLFLEGKIGVGKKTRLIFITPDVSADKKDAISQIDKRKSGDYLITAIHHTMSIDDYGVSLRLTKLGDLPKNLKL